MLDVAPQDKAEFTAMYNEYLDNQKKIKSQFDSNFDPAKLTEEEAKVAFRKLAKTCHPDLHPNDPNAEKRFKEINEAYDRICKGDTQEQVHFRTGDFNFHDFGNGTQQIHNAAEPETVTAHDVIAQRRLKRGFVELLIRVVLDRGGQGAHFAPRLFHRETACAAVWPAACDGCRGGGCVGVLCDGTARRAVSHR